MDELEHNGFPEGEVDHASTMDSSAGSMTYKDLSSRDMHYYNKWKESQDPRDMAMIVKSMKPLILKEVTRLSGTLPTAALMGSAKKWTIQAVKTYDPSLGASLSTHVTNYLQKTRRLNYRYQNAARIPEGLHLQVQTFKEAKNNFLERNDREPTDEELAKELGWSKKQVINLKPRMFDDLTEGGSENPTMVHKSDEESLLMEHLKLALDPQEQEILFNPKELPINELAASLGMSMSRYQYVKTKLVKKIEAMKHEFNK